MKVVICNRPSLHLYILWSTLLQTGFLAWPYTLGGFLVISSTVLLDNTDFTLGVISSFEAHGSFNFISSQAFSPLQEAFTNANSPFSLFPFRINFILPLDNCRSSSLFLAFLSSLLLSMGS